ncbi:hypothetical protein [Serratia marcescens]|uniref:hypothetical protein n=1 Tax=Serratia TaxID=613 RepID=UPI003B9F3FB6
MKETLGISHSLDIHISTAMFFKAFFVFLDFKCFLGMLQSLVTLASQACQYGKQVKQTWETAKVIMG